MERATEIGEERAKRTGKGRPAAGWWTDDKQVGRQGDWWTDKETGKERLAG